MSVKTSRYHLMKNTHITSFKRVRIYNSATTNTVAVKSFCTNGTVLTWTLKPHFLEKDGSNPPSNPIVTSRLVLTLPQTLLSYVR